MKRKQKQHFFWQTLNSHLPLEYDLDRPQTLPKCVSDDSPHFIFRHPRTIVFRQFFQSWHPNASHLCWRSSDFLSISGRFFVKNNFLSFVSFPSTILGGGINELACVFEVVLASKTTFRPIFLVFVKLLKLCTQFFNFLLISHFDQHVHSSTFEFTGALEGFQSIDYFVVHLDSLLVSNLVYVLKPLMLQSIIGTDSLIWVNYQQLLY